MNKHGNVAKVANMTNRYVMFADEPVVVMYICQLSTTDNGLAQLSPDLQ